MATLSPELVQDDTAPNRAARTLDELEYQLSSLLGYACLGLCVVGLGFLVF